MRVDGVIKPVTVFDRYFPGNVYEQVLEYVYEIVSQLPVPNSFTTPNA